MQYEERKIIREQAVQIATEYMKNNKIECAEVPVLLEQTYETLIDITMKDFAPKNKIKIEEPAVPIEESVQSDCIICLEDGKKVKLLAPHLRKIGITIEDYMKKWDLPRNYPLVAPSTQMLRSATIKKYHQKKREQNVANKGIGQRLKGTLTLGSLRT